jgi:hypothetical protein
MRMGEYGTYRPSVLASGGRLSSSKLGSVPYVPQMVSPQRVSSSAEDRSAVNTYESMQRENVNICLPHIIKPLKTPPRSSELSSSSQPRPL